MDQSVDSDPSQLLIPESIDAGELVLRSPRDDDVPALVSACQDPEIARWTKVPSPYGPEDARRHIALAREGRTAGRSAHYLVEARSGSAGAAGVERSSREHALSGLLGTVALVNIDLPGRTAEVGYWVAASARGRGVAVAATSALVDWAFSVGLERVEANVMAGNDASRRVLEAMGFVEEGVLRSVPSGGCGQGLDRVDLHVYSQITSDRG